MVLEGSSYLQLRLLMVMIMRRATAHGRWFVVRGRLLSLPHRVAVRVGRVVVKWSGGGGRALVLLEMLLLYVDMGFLKLKNVLKKISSFEVKSTYVPSNV